MFFLAVVFIKFNLSTKWMGIAFWDAFSFPIKIKNKQNYMNQRNLTWVGKQTVPNCVCFHPAVTADIVEFAWWCDWLHPFSNLIDSSLQHMTWEWTGLMYLSKEKREWTFESVLWKRLLNRQRMSHSRIVQLTQVGPSHHYLPRLSMLYHLKYTAYVKSLGAVTIQVLSPHKQPEMTWETSMFRLILEKKALGQINHMWLILQR